MKNSNIKVADLRKELKARGLPSTGTKPELLARLEAAVTEKADDTSSIDADDDLLGDEDDDEELLDDEDEEEKLAIPSHPIITSATSTSPKKDGTEVAKGDSTGSKLKLNRQPISHPATATGQKSPSKALAPGSTPAAQPPKVIKTVITMAAEEKAQLRKEKFGASLSAPANTTTPQTPSSTNGAEALKKRNERFGLGGAVTGKISLKTPLELKLAKRKERFGEISSGPGDAKKVKGEILDEKMLKRAARFK